MTSASLVEVLSFWDGGRVEAPESPSLIAFLTYHFVVCPNINNDLADPILVT